MIVKHNIMSVHGIVTLKAYIQICYDMHLLYDCYALGSGLLNQRIYIYVNSKEQIAVIMAIAAGMALSLYQSVNQTKEQA